MCDLLDDMDTANRLRSGGDIAGACKLARKLLSVCQTLFGTTHPTTAAELTFIGSCEYDLGHVEQGLTLVKQGVEMRSKLYGPNDASVAFASNTLADQYSRAGRYDEATVRFEASLKILVDDDDLASSSTAIALANYGAHLLRIGKVQDAQLYLTKSIQEFENRGASSDPPALATLQLLAEALRSSGDNESADKMLKSYELLASRGEATASATKISMVETQARHLYLQKKFEEAATEYHKALTQVGRTYGLRSPNYEATLEGLFEVYVAQRDSAGIESVLRELLDFARLRREAAFSNSTVQLQFESTASDRVWLNRLMALATDGLLSASSAYEHLISIKGASTLNQRRIQLAAARPELKPLLDAGNV